MIKQIARHILAILLTIFITILIFVLLISSTILNENYVLKELEKSNYYSKVYENVKSNFENYIYQSNLDKTVLENIVTEEKVKDDTKSIIRHIYNGLEEEIDSQSIKENLKQNIDKEIENMNLNSSQLKAIDTLIETITNEYTKTILHFGYEKDIYTMYKSFSKLIDLAKKVELIVIAVCMVLLIIITRRRPYRIFTFTGISFISSGLLLVIFNQIINKTIKIQAITILNDAISISLRHILTEMLGRILFAGSILIITGVLTVIIANTVHNIKKYKHANYTNIERKIKSQKEI